MANDMGAPISDWGFWYTYIDICISQSTNIKNDTQQTSQHHNAEVKKKSSFQHQGGDRRVLIAPFSNVSTVLWPHGTSYSQIGDLSEQNGSFKMELIIAKQDLLKRLNMICCLLLRNLTLLPLFQLPGKKALQIKEQTEKQSQNKDGGISPTITFCSLRKQYYSQSTAKHPLNSIHHLLLEPQPTWM